MDKKNSQENHNSEILETKRRHFYEVVENLQTFNNWLCARHRYDIELREAKRKYQLLSHEDKDKIGYKEYLVKFDLCHKFIYDDYIRLVALNYYIQGLRDKYQYIFESIDNLKEYINLKREFDAFTQSIEASIAKDNINLPNIEVKIKGLLNDFISMLQLELR